MFLGTLSATKRFTLVAIINLVLDASLTLLLIHRGIDPFTSRALALPLALMMSWRINRALIWAIHRCEPPQENIQYAPIVICLMALNMGLYTLFLIGLPVLIAVSFATVLTSFIAIWGHWRIRTNLVV